MQVESFIRPLLGFTLMLCTLGYYIVVFNPEVSSLTLLRSPALVSSVMAGHYGVIFHYRREEFNTSPTIPFQ